MTHTTCNFGNRVTVSAFPAAPSPLENLYAVGHKYSRVVEEEFGKLYLQRLFAEKVNPEGEPRNRPGLPHGVILTTGKDGNKYRTGRKIGHKNRELVLEAIGGDWASVPDVARAIGLSDHNTRKWFRKLQEAGEIEVRREKIRSNRSNIFGRVKREAAA